MRQRRDPGPREFRNCKSIQPHALKPTLVYRLFKRAEYLFNVVHGRSGPAEGDTRVFGIRVDKILIAECERFTHYLELKKIAWRRGAVLSRLAVADCDPYP